MRKRGFRLTFLWRFALATAVVSLLSAIFLAYALERSHRQAVELDTEVAALGRISAELTDPLDGLDANRPLSPAARAALGRVTKDAEFFQYVTGVRLYRPNGLAVYPSSAPPDVANVHAALASDSFVHVDRGSTVTAYSPEFARGEQAYVVALDFSRAQFGLEFRRERDQIARIVAAVGVIIFLSLVALAAGASRELERRRREAQETFVQTLSVMAETIDLRDPYTAGHSRRVAEYSRRLSEALGLSAREVEVVERGALLHDIGKIGVPDRVLFKPAALDAHERAIIGTHPTIGARLLEGIAAMEEIVPCVLHHHEKVDGTGYPGKLRAAAIPRGARIIAVADAFDAMTTDRPYRAALATEAAIAELIRVAGSQLDCAYVETFVDLVRRGEASAAPAAASQPARFGRKAEFLAAS